MQIGGEDKEVRFFVVEGQRSRAQARELLNGRYGWRGYGSAHELQMDAHHTTFAAEIDGQIVGTMTLGVDSGHGLAIDRTFPVVVAEARQEAGAKICELTKLAFDDSVRSTLVLAGLFHLAYIYGTTSTDCTDLFIEVNPRHMRFYQTMLGFRSVGSESTNMSVGAPSRLMRLSVDEIRLKITRMTHAPVQACARSLYPYFFPPEEEREIRLLIEFARASAADTPERLEAPIGAILAQQGRTFGTSVHRKEDAMRSAA